MDWTDLASRGLHIADIPGAAIRSLLVGQVPYFNLTDDEGRVSGEDVLEYWGGPRNSYLGTGIEMLTGAVGDVGGALALRSLLKGVPAARLVMEAMPRGPRRRGMVINPFSYVGGEAEAGKNALMRGDVAIRPSTVVGEEALGKTDAMKLAKAVDTPEERALRIEAIIDNMRKNPPVDPSDLVGPDGWAAWVNSVPSSKAAKGVADKMAAKAAAAKEVQASLADSQLANILAGKPSPSVRGGVRASAAAQASSDAEADLAELLTGRRMLKRRDFGPIAPEAAMAEFPPASARRGSLADFVRKPALTSPGGPPTAGRLVEPLRLPAPATTSREFMADIGAPTRTPRYTPQGLQRLLGYDEPILASIPPRLPTTVDELLGGASAVHDVDVRRSLASRLGGSMLRHPYLTGGVVGLAGTLGAAGIASLLQGDADEEPATPVSQEPVIRQEPKSSSLRMPKLPQPEVLVETPRIQFGSRKWFGAPPAPEAQPASSGGGRMFTDRAGRQLHGEILETTPDAALFRRSRDGKLAWIARGNLSEADQAVLE